MIIDDVHIKFERGREPELWVTINNQTNRPIDISGWPIIVTKEKWKPGLETPELLKPWFVFPKNIKENAWILNPGCKAFVFDEKGEVEIKEEESRVNYYFYTKPIDTPPLALLGFSIWYGSTIILYDVQGREIDHKVIEDK